MAKQIITQKRLKELLNYNPETGAFIRLVSIGGQPSGAVIKGKDKQGYVVMRVDGKVYKAHRLAFLYITGRFPEHHVDHIDHNRSNNIFSNLRKCTDEMNSKNRCLDVNNSSGFCGVSWDSQENKWCAYININKKRINLGRYHDKNLAVFARWIAEDGEDSYHPNHGS